MDNPRSRPGRHRWDTSLLICVAAGVILTFGKMHVSSVIIAAVLVALAVIVSPLFFPRSDSDAAGRELASRNGVPLIYWRPGCSYCLRLRLALGRAGKRAVWVDVSRDGDASARVREFNHGNETVPTVFVGQTGRVNPRPQWVRQQLTAAQLGS